MHANSSSCCTFNPLFDNHHVCRPQVAPTFSLASVSAMASLEARPVARLLASARERSVALSRVLNVEACGGGEW